MWLCVVLFVLVCTLIVFRGKSGRGRMPPEYPGALPFIGHGYLFASIHFCYKTIRRATKPKNLVPKSCFEEYVHLCNKLRALTKDTKYPLALRKLMNDVKVMSMRVDKVQVIQDLAFIDVMKDIAMTSLAWGGVVSFKLGPKLTNFMISDPEDCAIIANTCLDKPYVYDLMKPVLGEGLVTGKVSTWKAHRKLLMPAFNQAVLDSFIGVFNSQGQRLVEGFQRLSEGKPVDCCGLVDHNALETICLTAMGGSNANEVLSAEYLNNKAKANEVVIKRFQTIWLHSDFIFNLSSLKKTFNEAIKIIHDGSNSVIQNKRAESSDSTERSGIKFKAFIDLIMELSGEKGLLTDQEIREEVDTIILAGHETTALSLTYTLILLGSHPEVQERVFKEISEVVGEKDVEKQDLSKLTYLEAVLKESLRLYPIAPYIARQITHDVKIRNYTLPAGSGVFLAIGALHQHARWGADAAQFAPARWLDAIDHAVYAAFSIGKRNCIGQTYAMMGMKTTLVHLIRNFRITSDISKLKLKLNILMEPSSGHQISIERRK